MLRARSKEARLANEERLTERLDQRRDVVQGVASQMSASGRVFAVLASREVSETGSVLFVSRNLSVS